MAFGGADGDQARELNYFRLLFGPAPTILAEAFNGFAIVEAVDIS